ncbi:MAG: hypothetical protein ACTS27_05100 [Phycisphaerales bacterium]
MSDAPDADMGAEDWREPPKWPKVVGIISIVWAVLGIVCNGLGVVGTLMTPQLMQMAEAEMEGGFPPQMTQPNMMLAGISVVSLLVAIGLLLAGIFTVNRRPQGRTFHLGVAVASIVVLAIAIAAQWSNMTAIGEWVQNNPDAAFSQNYSPTSNMIGMAVGIVLGSAWPVFLLIWFGALGKRPEQDAPEVL